MDYTMIGFGEGTCNDPSRRGRGLDLYIKKNSAKTHEYEL